MEPLVVFAVVLVSVGFLAVIVHRGYVARRSATETPMTRLVLAVLLVGGLIVLAVYAVTKGVNSQATNLLVGAVISLSSAAVAFYFASSGATEARRDLLTATGGLVQAPDLNKMQVQQARKLMSGSDLALLNDPPTAGETDEIVSQVPNPGALVPHRTPITATPGTP